MKVHTETSVYDVLAHKLFVMVKFRSLVSVAAVFAVAFTAVAADTDPVHPDLLNEHPVYEIPPSGAARCEKPNVVVFLADDFGCGSINAYGASRQHIRTPHMDRLAREGMRFTEAYATASVCSPSRYAMLTGRYAWRGRLKHSVVHPGQPLLIEEGRRTLPMMLQEQGYHTAHIGKWHLGYTRLPRVANYAVLDEIAPGPRSVGFDYHFGIPNNLDDDYRVYFENEQIYGLRSTRKSVYSRCYYGSRYAGYDAPQRRRDRVTSDLNQRATEWIRETLADHPDKPMFLYFAAAAVHHPIEPSDEFVGTSPVGYYGDFIQELDHSVGTVMDALAYAGELDNTIFIFSSDNGGDFGQSESPEQFARDMGLTPNNHFRGDKHTVWDGGTRVPLIVRWPGKVEAGTVSDRLVSLADIFATLQELITGEALEGFETAPDSFSFADALVGAKRISPERQQLVMRSVVGVKALRRGAWKYVEGIHADIEDQRKRVPKDERNPSMYRLDADPGENKDLLETHPEMAQSLKDLLNYIRSDGSERRAQEGRP